MTRFLKNNSIVEILLFVSLTIIVGIVCGCNFGGLSRSEAESLIKNSQEAVRLRKYMILHPGGVEKGVEQGFLQDIRYTQYNIKIRNTPISSTGKKYFDVFNAESGFLTPKDQSAKIEIEVSGITDSYGASNVKEAQFSWRYSDIPSVVGRFVVSGGDGTALFRKYDDGWRIENISTTTSDVPYQISSAEIEEEAKLVYETKKINVELERQKQVELAKMAELENLSKTPTAVIGTFRFYSFLNSTFLNKKTIGNITLTDVDLSYDSAESIGQQYTKYNIWFGSIEEIRYNQYIQSDNQWVNFPRVYIKVKGNQFMQYAIPFEDYHSRDEFCKKLTEAYANFKRNYYELF